MDAALSHFALQDPIALLWQNALTITLLLIFLAAVLSVLGAWALVTDRAAVKKRLQQTAGNLSAADQSVSLRFKENNGWLRLFQPLYHGFIPKDSAFISTARLKLVQAGYMHPTAVTTFYAIKVLVAVALGLGVLVLAPLALRTVQPMVLLLTATV